MSNSAIAPEVISLRIPSRLELLGVLDCVAIQICERMKFDAEAAAQISMSVIEAGTTRFSTATNAMRHDSRRRVPASQRLAGDHGARHRPGFDPGP